MFRELLTLAEDRSLGSQHVYQVTQLWTKSVGLSFWRTLGPDTSVVCGWLWVLPLLGLRSGSTPQPFTTSAVPLHNHVSSVFAP